MKKDLLDKIRVVKGSHLNGVNEKLMPKQPGFSWRARIKSFGYAWSGIIYFFRTEHNARIHLAATIVVMVLSFLFKLSRTELMIILFSNGFVWVTEMLNTAIEKTIDFVSTERHQKIRIIKDISAGAVLVAAISAALAGLIIFIPKFSAL